MNITKAARAIAKTMKLKSNSTIKESLKSFANNTNTANKTAVEIEPKETIFVSAIIARANTKQISPIFQFINITIPKLVATPLPPLNLKNTGKVCPTITKNAANSTKIAGFISFTIFPTITAINTDTTPFNISHTSVSSATFFPIVLNTFVVPAFLLPFSLTSNPAIFLLKIIAKLTLPIRYAINPTNMYTMIF